jgi:AcrR family transcriptional regulator
LAARLPPAMRSPLNSSNGDSTATRELAGLSNQSTRKRDRAAKQSALIQAATELFAVRGFERTTTRAIAARAGCAEGLIHRYFNGKAGLLLAIIHSRVSQEVVDLSDKLPLPMKLEDEILQLVDWELDRMWEDRDFLSVIIPRALVDPEIGPVLSKIGPPRHAKAIAERLKRFKQCRSLPDEEREAVALFIGVVGFVFGFMRPVVLGRDRNEARKTALTLANIFVRSLRENEEISADCRAKFGGAGRNRTDV